MIVAERRFKKEIRFATSSYLSEMEFKGSKKQKKTTVCSKCTDFFLIWRLVGQGRVLKLLLYVQRKHENVCFYKLALAHAMQELSLTREEW